MGDSVNGFVITKLGLNLIAKWGAGAPRIILDVMVGSGRVPLGTVLTDLTDLITPVAQGTTTVPITVDSQIQFVVEYRNELQPTVGGFWLNEYGVFATDPDLGRVLLCYGTLDDTPEWMPPFSSGILTTRHYPVSIGVSGSGEVILSYPANAFMTADEVAAFFENAAGNMIELSAVDVPQSGTKLHFRITADSNYQPEGVI